MAAHRRLTRTARVTARLLGSVTSGSITALALAVLAGW